MSTTGSDTLPVRSSDDVVRVRQRARALGIEAGLSLVDQTKIVTAASELARNMIDYAGGGHCIMDIIGTPPRRGVRITFEDKGPGIANIEQALKDGYTTGSGLGLGLGGAKRLSSEFTIQSKPGEGTKVVITRWK
jgi:serine/threonine-protein kinase RsbT